MQKQNCFNPLIDDVQTLYKSCRTAGKSREDAIGIIKTTYVRKLQDEDDRIAVLIGLTLALCEKRELTKEIALETAGAIRSFRQSGVLRHTESMYLMDIERLLNDDSLQGAEAAYSRRHKYRPNWIVGDTFAHTLTYPKAKQLGIEGWCILFYKVGEYVDHTQRCNQLMYISLCPPDKIPATTEQLQALGFLRMMQHDEKWDYLAQIQVESKKDEMSYGFSKIGNFPNVVPPADRTDENPALAMPLFGYLRDGDFWPGYEDQICRLYKKFGLPPSSPL